MSEPTPLLAPLKPQLAPARLWRDDRFVADVWVALADDAALSLDGAIIVSAARWTKERDVFGGTKRPIGVRVGNDADLAAVMADLAAFDLIALAFPKFSDGRAYSFARRLREAGFTGEIRATGDVLLDQLPLMLRAGFDAFEITNAATIAALEKRPVPAVSRVYQAAQETAPHVWHPRRRAV